MRFDLIDIPAFGPFTDFTITLQSSDHDIHLIYGENEAGKSSLLRGIHQMFYGIPTRSTDNFLHDNKQLLTGGKISTPTESLHFYRKKGNKNTLLNSEKSNIGDEMLKPFLGAVDSGFFDSMFGLNTENLRAGAQALIDPQSDLGTQIFSASMGGSPIDTAIKKLEAEADQLFKGRSVKSVSIPDALKDYKEGEKNARSESIKVSAWNSLQKEIHASDAILQSVNDEQRSHNARILHITNVLSALPNYRKLREFEKQLTALNAPQLPSDFSDRFRKLLISINENELSIELHKKKIEDDEKKLKYIPDHSEILKDETEIESVQRNIESHLHHLEEAKNYQSQLKHLAADINELTTQLELKSSKEIDTLPDISTKQHSQFQQVVEELSQLEHQLKQSEKDHQKLEINIRAHQAEINQHNDAADTSALEALLDRATTTQAKQEQHQKDQQQLQKATQLRVDLIERLDIETIAINKISRLKLPSTDSISAEKNRKDDLLAQLQKHRKQRDGLNEELAIEKTGLDRLKKKETIYNQDDLVKARQTRDELVQTIASSSQPEQTVIDSIAEAVVIADTIVDTLHRNAASITKADAHLDKIQILTLHKENIERSISETTEEIKTWDEEWHQRCVSIPAIVQSPVDLLQWRELWEELCSVIETISELASNDVSHQQEVGSLLETMRITLDEPELDFSTLHRQIKARIKSANQAHGKQQSAEKALAKAEFEQEQGVIEFNSITEALHQKQSDWRSYCTLAELPDDLKPSATLDLITLRENAKTSRNQQTQLHLKLEELEDSIQQFTQKMHHLVLKQLNTEPDALELPVDTLAGQLKSALEEAKKTQTQSATIQKSIDTAKQDLPPLEIQSVQLNKELDSFYKQARVSDAEAMELAIMSIEKYTQLTGHTETLRSTLIELADGTDLDDFLQQLDEEDAYTLKLEKSELEALTQSIQEQRDDARAALYELKTTESDLKQASDTAAQHKQQSANALSRIVNDTDRYIKLHHAIHFLKQQVEAYREQTQGPMIEKTSHYFNALTCGAFTGVAAQIGDKDIPQLVALRANDQQQVNTAGLSEGTLDQLYLSLRLAAIDLHLDTHPAIPLILDDLLITFDDDRTRALLPVLEKLSQKTQILIFTHHQHLIELTKHSAPTIQHHML